MKFRSDVCFSNSSLDAVDEHAGVIKGVTIAREGIAKGHGVFLDSEFISKVAQLGNEAEQGVKVRFGHPNMCSDALGTYLGRFKNFRVVEDKVYADLHMDEVAKKSPNGDLYSYVFAMARSNPDMFGNSIVFRAGESRFEEEMGENEEVIKKEYTSIVALHASDLVDTPAATESLFSSDMSSAKITQFLQENPEIEELLFNTPDIDRVVEQFKNRYENYKSKKNKMEKSFSEKVKDALVSFGLMSENAEESNVAEVESNEETPVAEEAPAVEEPKEEFSNEEATEAMEQAVEKFEEEKEELTKAFDAKEADLNHALAELGEEVKSLKAELDSKQAELDALSAKPTELEGEADANITGEEAKLSSSQEALMAYLKEIKG